MQYISQMYNLILMNLDIKQYNDTTNKTRARF